MSMRAEWGGSLSGMETSIDRWWARVEGRLPGELAQAGARMVAFARTNHPWRNITGAAEAGLTVEVRREGDTFVLEFRHSVYYGIFLEKRWGGRWGVIPQTISMGAPLVMQAATRALNG